MATFLLSYRMPRDYAHGRPGVAETWQAWFAGLGTSLAERGNPTFESAALGECGPGTKLGGFSLITADDLESAIALAKSCPAVQSGAGGVEVGVIPEPS
jgi:YCII-related domain